MVKEHKNNLFNSCNLSIILENIYNSIMPQVEAIPEKEFLATSDTDLVAKLVQLNTVEQITFDEENIRMHTISTCKMTPSGKPYFPVEGENPPDLQEGIVVQVEVPYSGDKRLLVSRPSMNYKHGGPSFTIKGDRIVKDYVGPLYSDPASFKAHFKSNFTKIKKYLSWQAQDIAMFEKRLRNKIVESIAERRDRPDIVELCFTSREGATDFFPDNILNDYTNSDSTPTTLKNPVISEDAFSRIIRVLRHTGKTFERTPAIYSVHNDLDLRNILVSNLNTHFVGKNNKDIFYRSGKTGFNVPIYSKATFKGKCLSWQCEEGFTYTLSRMLDNNHWHSCKMVLIVFNRTEADFKELLKIITQNFSSHPYQVQLKQLSTANECHALMHTANDHNRRHEVYMMVFNLYFGKDFDSPYLNDAERKFFVQN
ncbi:hypothetical protein [Maridesulfovibrio sp.]|uniref:hypothetical protein n=1 Tax=Maridesulfovibrio sp. TaxID=2795000 RepID=UPI0029C9FF03|nr:hypothetical protein [Maridesulfovibrio sp.]